ncbi:MauE/DoxX family redox-associated membrane protein [Streptomyces hydrogenans]|uniref:MauE/DoxX family redox-associated membrane protein n=1 Tax=Streptomyces hydrogenans TaxID=1873719 RepID=UPI0033E4AA39
MRAVAGMSTGAVVETLAHTPPPRTSGRWRRSLPSFARLLLSAVWWWAGWTKLRDPEGSVQAVRAFRVLPEVWVETVAYGVPALEIGLALLLLFGVGGRLGAVVSAVVLAVFVAALVQAWARGLSVDCGCFGGGGEVDATETRYGQEIARDLGLLAVNLWLCFRRSAPSAASLTAPPPTVEPPT